MDNTPSSNLKISIAQGLHRAKTFRKHGVIMFLKEEQRMLRRKRFFMNLGYKYFHEVPESVKKEAHKHWPSITEMH